MDYRLHLQKHCVWLLLESSSNLTLQGHHWLPTICSYKLIYWITSRNHQNRISNKRMKEKLSFECRTSEQSPILKFFVTHIEEGTGSRRMFLSSGSKSALWKERPELKITLINYLPYTGMSASLVKQLGHTVSNLMRVLYINLSSCEF